MLVSCFPAISAAGGPPFCVPCLFYLVKERYILSKRWSHLGLYIIVFYPLWMLICTIKPFLTASKRLLTPDLVVVRDKNKSNTELAFLHAATLHLERPDFIRFMNILTGHVIQFTMPYDVCTSEQTKKRTWNPTSFQHHLGWHILCEVYLSMTSKQMINKVMWYMAWAFKDCTESNHSEPGSTNTAASSSEAQNSVAYIPINTSGHSFNPQEVVILDKKERWLGTGVQCAQGNLGKSTSAITKQVRGGG